MRGLGPSAGWAGKGRPGWECRLRRQECVLRRTQEGGGGGAELVARGTGREVRGDAHDGVVDVGGWVCEDVQ